MTVLVRRRTLDLAIAGTVPPNFNNVTQSTPVSLGDVLLRQWVVRIPNGHAGLTGVALLLNGATIVPFDQKASPYVIGNDSLFTFDIEVEVDQGLTVAQLNQDIYQHTHYLQFVYTPIAAASLAPAPFSGAVPIS